MLYIIIVYYYTVYVILLYRDSTITLQVLQLAVIKSSTQPD